MTKEEILAAAGYPNTPEGVAAFYNEYGTPEAFFAKHGGSLSGAPHNGQPTADQFFSYGSHANDQINIPMGNPFYLQTGGMYHSDGPFYHAQDGINVTFAQPKTSAQYNRMKTNLGYTDEELKGVGVSKPGLSDQFLQKQKELKGTYKPATGGGYTMIGEDPSKVYDYYVGQGYKLRGMPDVASTLPPQRYGGGLPGGPHEMPCMECGGYMDMGGYNSPTNYGSFSVPMNNGGLPMGQAGTIVDWAKKEQQALQQRTGMTTPSEAKRYFGAFEAPSPEQMDSIHVSPINPNIGMGFKGSKSMLLPLNKSAAQDVYKINKPFTLATPPQKGEREVFVQYQEFGGAYDPSVAGTYPSMNKGGLKKIINAFVKKAYGGDTVIPGGNDTDYPQQIRSNFMKGVSNLYQKALTDEITNDFYQEMTNIPMAQNGWQAGQQRLINKLYTEPSFGATPQFTPLPKRQMYSEGAPTPDQYENVYYRGSGPEGSSKKGAYRFSFQDPRSFPGIFDSYYKINKRNVDKAKKALDEGYGLADVEKVYGLGARTAMNIGNIFRKAENKKTEPGFAPKKIKYTFTKPKPGIVDFFDTTADTLPMIPTNLPTYSPESADLMLPKARVGNNPIDMSEEQDKITVTAKEKEQLTPEGALFGSTAAGFLGDTITNFQRKLAAEREMYPMPGSDDSPFGAVAGSHGEYTINQGFLQPQMYTPGMQENRIMTSAEGGELVKALSGLEIKMRPGLYGTNGNRQFSLPTQIDSQKYAKPEVKVGGVLGPVDRSVANLEAEKGETAVMELGGLPAHFTIGGKRHSEGGTPLNLPDNSFIFSDTAKMKIKDPVLLLQFGMPIKKGGYTPADIAKKYDINKYRKVLADKESDETEIKTAELMIAKYNIKLAKLAIIQEAMKGFPQGIPAIAMPYILSNNVEITELLGKVNPEALTAQQMEDEQEMSTEGMEDNPNADMGVSRFGGNIVAQIATKKYGGLNEDGIPMAQFGDIGLPSFQEWKSKMINPDEDYVSKAPPKKRKISKEQAFKELDAQERRILGVIQDFRSKDMDLPEYVIKAYKTVEAAKKKLGPAPEQKPYKGEMAYYTSEGKKARPTIAGTEQWMSYSGEKDPAKSYWERVKSANLFRRDPSHGWFSSETDVVDPRMQEALEKVIPFYGKEAEGFGDWARTLSMMPQYEMNNLLTGYYENPYTTYLRYNKAPESAFWRAAMKYGTDPMIVDLPYNILAKGLTKGAKKTFPYLGKYADVVYDLTTKYGSKLANIIADQAIKLYGKITPKIADKILSGLGKVGQMSMHEGEDKPVTFAPEVPFEPGKTPYYEPYIEYLIPKEKSVLLPASDKKTKTDTTEALEEPDFDNMIDWENVDWTKYKE